MANMVSLDHCSNYFKTKCNGKPAKTESYSSNKPKSSTEEIETDLECPECI